MSWKKPSPDAAPRPFDITQAAILGLSMLAGLLAFWLTARYINNELKKVEDLRRELYRDAQTVRVVAAGRDLPSGTRLQQSDLGIRSVLQSSVTQSTIRDDPREIEMILGKTLRFSVQNRAVLSWNDIDMPYQPRGGLAPMIRPGLRALSISVTGPSSVSGLVQPNDRVDVLGTFTFPSKTVPGDIETLTLTMLQDVIVLATGQQLARSPGGRDAGGGRGGYNTVTLHITPREAEMLVFAQTMRGNLTLTLRNPEDISFERNLPEINFDHIEQHLEDLNLHRQREIHKKQDSPAPVPFRGVIDSR